MNWTPNRVAFDRLIALLLAEVDVAFVVGGAVRDYLRNPRAQATDLDIVIADRATPIARRVADRLGWAYFPMGTGHDVARLVFPGEHGPALTCDVAGMRGLTIEDDLAARDFTVNAMAIVLENGRSTRLLDPHGGRQDLEAGVLRRVSPVSLLQDPIRLLRAVRLMVQFDLDIDPATRSQAERLTETIRLSSTERARDELWKMLASPHPRIAVQLLREFGLLRYVLPEVAAMQGVLQSPPHHLDVYDHTLAAVDAASTLRDWIVSGVQPANDPNMAQVIDLLRPVQYDLRRHFSHQVAAGHGRAEWLVWHALFHDTGKPGTIMLEVEDGSVGLDRRSGDEGDEAMRYRFIGHETLGAELTTLRLTELRFSSTEVAMCAAVVRGHMRPHLLDNSFPTGEISRKAAFRYFRDVGGKQFGRGLGVDTLILALADYLAVHGVLPDTWPVYKAHIAQLLDDYFAVGEGKTTELLPLVNGHELMHMLGIEQGIVVGNLLDQIMEAQVAGEVTTRSDAIALARRLYSEESRAF
jgi:poly(A) polymerase